MKGLRAGTLADEKTADHMPGKDNGIPFNRERKKNNLEITF